VDEPNLRLMSPEVGQLDLVQLRLAWLCFVSGNKFFFDIFFSFRIIKFES